MATIKQINENNGSPHKDYTSMYGSDGRFVFTNLNSKQLLELNTNFTK